MVSSGPKGTTPTTRTTTTSPHSQSTHLRSAYVFFLDRDVSKEKCASYPGQGRKYAGGLDSGGVNRVTVSFKWAGKNNWMLYYLDAFYALGRKLVENDDAEPCVGNDFEVSAHRSFWRAALLAVVGDLNHSHADLR